MALTRHAFPGWAAGLGLGIAITLALFGQAARGPDEPAIPLLLELLLSEFGFLLTAAGLVVGIRNWLNRRGNASPLILAGVCALLSVSFLIMGLLLWQGHVAGSSG